MLRLEDNPFFNLDLSRHGRSAFIDWLRIPREQATTPGPECKQHGNVSWWRVTVGAYCVPSCRCVITSGGRDLGPAGGFTPEWQA